MILHVEYEREDDGRWLAQVLELAGVMAYGDDAQDAVAKAKALALRVLADQIEHGEVAADLPNIVFEAA